jgi:hypothetical protein
LPELQRHTSYLYPGYKCTELTFTHSNSACAPCLGFDHVCVDATPLVLRMQA